MTLNRGWLPARYGICRAGGGQGGSFAPSYHHTRFVIDGMDVATGKTAPPPCKRPFAYWSRETAPSSHLQHVSIGCRKYVAFW